MIGEGVVWLRREKVGRATWLLSLSRGSLLLYGIPDLKSGKRVHLRCG